MALRCVIPSPNTKEAALSFILGGNSNKVVWDDCQFIWDSRELVAAASGDEVANFGAKGKVVTPENELLRFYLRHCLDFGPQPKYRLYAAVEEKPGSRVDEKNIRDQDIASRDDRAFFQKCVLDLTEQVRVLGLERVMRSFLS